MARRLSIRLRLTLATALVMGAVLAAVGAFVYLRLESELDSGLDRGLRLRVDDVAALARAADGDALGDGGSGSTEADESVAQVLDATGRVVDATTPLRSESLLAPEELERALQGSVLVDRDRLSPELDDAFRLLATPVERAGGRVVVVVGASLDERNEALASLRTQLVIIEPLALLAACALGYLLAAAALRPVESMRREADAISALEPGRRLPVPEPRDEIARLGETLNGMLARLEEALARERRLVADASHELRTPLALVRAELELALRRPRPAAELAQSIRSAAEETDRLVQLAEALLVLARSDERSLPLSRSAVDVTELLGSVARRFHTRAVAAGRELVVRAPAGLVLSADALRLEQAVANLVDNALRHGEGTVTLRALEAGATVELHVEDEGRGFPADFLPRAFERFSRADDARSRGGSGLGLALVRAIAIAHGGTAHASNREQGGADVSIALPRSVDAPAVAAGALIRGSSPAPTVGSSTDAAGTRP